MNIEAKMHSQFIEKRLQGLSGFSFEEHARFLLKLIYRRFIFTRLRGDGGIDGYLRTNMEEKNSKVKVIEIFSTYAKEPSSKPDKKKISTDLIQATKYAEERGFQFKKWNLVINFILDTDFRSSLEDICQEQGIEFEEINPTVLVGKIKGKEKIFEAACYFDAIIAPKSPYSNYSYHELAKKALIDISNSMSNSTDEKYHLLKDIVSTILKFSFIDKKTDLPLSNFYLINTNTRIHQDFIFYYKFTEGFFLPTEQNKASIVGHFTKDENGHYIVNIQNLYPIYLLCTVLLKQLDKSGTFHLPEALQFCFKRERLIIKKATGS
ncbi:hypothetical protein [Peribacillus sp. S4]|uniref:hypothetical protein n=1 Tax=Peribacillus sp. S4 TaxID=3384451 RepID=UPI00398A0594